MRTVAAPRGEQTSSDMEDTDSRHPWPYLKEMVVSLILMFIILGLFIKLEVRGSIVFK